jgi:flagellin-like protein
MRKLLKSKKALSPVVAAIILIAVTVAVSIAVAAWMGSMTFTFMETEQLSITNMVFTDNTGTPDVITVYVQNTGTTDIAIMATVTVQGNGVASGAGTTTAATIAAGASGNYVVTLGASDELAAGAAYNVELLSTKGNKFSYTATA